MKIKDARITILCNHDHVTIEVEDRDANTEFVKITMTPKQWCEALSRAALTKCKAEVCGLDRIGKKHENRPLEAPMPDGVGRDERKDIAADAIAKVLPDGWVSDDYFGSQGSFFIRDGKPWCRTTIRRWV
jgi:hypothetical protein